MGLGVLVVGRHHAPTLYLPLEGLSLDHLTLSQTLDLQGCLYRRQRRPRLLPRLPWHGALSWGRLLLRWGGWSQARLTQGRVEWGGPRRSRSVGGQSTRMAPWVLELLD